MIHKRKQDFVNFQFKNQIKEYIQQSKNALFKILELSKNFMESSCIVAIHNNTNSCTRQPVGGADNIIYDLGIDLTAGYFIIMGIMKKDFLQTKKGLDVLRVT